jgi:hypothetical protein
MLTLCPCLYTSSLGGQSTGISASREGRLADGRSVQTAHQELHHLLDCLYLSQKLAEIDDPVKREEFLLAMARGSAAAWRHLNLLGEYDFSEHKLQDSVGIKAPKLTD